MSEEQGKTPQPGTAITKVNDYYLPMIERQLSGNGIAMDPYAKQCVLAALSSIHTILDAKSIQWDDKQLDKSSLTQALMAVACLQLNGAAHPREVYFQIRNTKVKAAGEGGKQVDVWKKSIEMGIEGDGNDRILAKFGRDVKKVGQFWLVRADDKFEYPCYNGLQVEPPKWTPTGKGQVVRVVYPVLKNDNSIEFYIGERDDVLKNLMAHLNNNLMNETFGVCKNRWEADAKQQKEIAVKKAEVLKRASELGFGVLDDPELQQWISPAWTDYHSRESMIIRKMRNNVVKKIPKDFGSAYIQITYSEQVEEAPIRAEIAANANGEVIDIPTPEDAQKAEEASGSTTAAQAPAKPETADKPKAVPVKEPAPVNPSEADDGPGY